MTTTELDMVSLPDDSSLNTRLAFGVDIGGSNIKGGIVNLDTGTLVGERYSLPTPQPATPPDVAKVVAQIVQKFHWVGPVGVTFPGVVEEGTIYTCAHLDSSWIGVNARETIAAELPGNTVIIVNDADAAGVSECCYGVGKDRDGLLIMLTFGTGIGSAVMYNGTLWPNTELGHLEVHGKEAELRAAASIKTAKEWSMKQWARQVSRVLVVIENALAPDLFIAGGGISRKADKWIPLLTNRVPMIGAKLQNTAGIVGAAMATHDENLYRR